MTQPTKQEVERLFDHGLTIEDVARMFHVRADEIRKLMKEKSDDERKTG